MRRSIAFRCWCAGRGLYAGGKRRVSGPVSHVDRAPTFLEYFGVPYPRAAAGRKLPPGNRAGPIRGNRTYDPIFIEYNRFELDHDGYGSFLPLRRIFDGRCKLSLSIFWIPTKFTDLSTDPAELHNLIHDSAHTAIRDRLHDAVLDWMNRTRDPLRSPALGAAPVTGAKCGPFGRLAAWPPRPGDESTFPIDPSLRNG